MEGWGGHVFRDSPEEVEEAKHHINWLELKAALLTVYAICSDYRDMHIELIIDKMMATACISKMGSTKPAWLQLMQEVHQWAMARYVQLSVAHIPA